MFNQLYTSKHVIQRHLNYPMLKERLQYLQYWRDNGATLNTLHQTARNLLIIVDFLDLKHKKKMTIPEIEHSAKEWGKNYGYSRDNICRRIRIAIHWLSMIKMLKISSPKSTLFSRQLLKFGKYMREERGLSETTIKNKIRLLKNLFNPFPDKDHLLKKINCLAIDAILEKKKNDGYSRRSIQKCVSVIRSFLMYAENRGWCKKDISTSIFSPRSYAYESLPKSPSWNNVKKLLSTTDGDQHKNIRDRAILMLLSIYGLRTGEVITLKLKDIDWENEIIFLTRPKNGKSQKLPLSKYVGKAIMRYVKEARQNHSSCKELFICMKAPYRPLGRAAVFQIVSKRWKLIDKDTKPFGPHSLRHACATHLINEGISLKEICDYLGHQSIDSTRVYTKVDLKNLRKVADFNIGDLL